MSIINIITAFISRDWTKLHFSAFVERCKFLMPNQSTENYHTEIPEILIFQQEGNLT